MASDGGKLSGKLIVLARGNETLLGYPRGVLNMSGKGSLINIEKGDFFSISRFRRGRARFSTSGVQNAIRQLQVLAVSDSNELLVNRVIKVPPMPPKPVPKPTPLQEAVQENEFTGGDDE